MSPGTTLSGAFERHSGRVVLAIFGATLVLLIPLFFMGTEEDAQLEPDGEVFDLRDDIGDRFPPAVFEVLFLVEARDGDVLTQEVLSELHANLQALREADARGELAAGDLAEQPYLIHGLHPETGEPFVGGYTLVDAVQHALASQPSLFAGATLEEATEEEVKLALHHVLGNPATREFRDSLAETAGFEQRTVLGQQIEYWTSPALVFHLGADNDELGGGLQEIVVGGDSEDLDRERFQRNMQELGRGDEASYRLWAVGVDANLQAFDDGERAGPFIMLTVVAALAVVGITLRSYWGVALTGAGLGMLMIWLKGGSNLIGIKGGLVVDFIVPIAMVSLGVDFAIHALRRYREERHLGLPPRRALRVGFAGVLGALTLAMLSGATAFLSNVSSPIEAVAEFGVTAALAVMSAFVVLGIGVPLVSMRVDEMRGALAASPQAPGEVPGAGGRLWPLLGGVGVAVSSGVGVILLVAVDVYVGAAAILASIALTVGVPFAVLRSRFSRAGAVQGAHEPAQPQSPSGAETRWMAYLVSLVGRHRTVVAVATVIVTGAALFSALRLDTGMDVRELFSHDSDLVVGLDKLDEHVAQHQRESAHLYIRGDLTDPETLEAVLKVKERVAEIPHVFRGEDGEAGFEPDVFTMLVALGDREDGPPNGEPGPADDGYGEPGGEPAPVDDGYGEADDEAGLTNDSYGEAGGESVPPDDEYGEADGEAGPADDEYGEAGGEPAPPDDGYGEADDEAGPADDSYGETGSEPGHADDGYGSADGSAPVDGESGPAEGGHEAGVGAGDLSGHGLLETREQIKAAFDHLVEHGVELDSGVVLFDPAQVRQVLEHDPAGGNEQVMLMSVPILGTRVPATVRDAQRDLEASLALLDDVPGITFHGVTGPAFTRQATLDATTSSLQRSLPIAAATVFAMLLVSMRSVRYAFVTIIPVALVAVWLYGLMQVMGYNLNIVTATIGAVSIGVGIDYAIHLTERFREELARVTDAAEALSRAAGGTGVALLTSSASSIVGFTVMAFAPMPLFASYGLLTALMIFLAVSASLLVLPALLLFVTPQPRKEQGRLGAGQERPPAEAS